MSNDMVPYGDIERMAAAIVKSNLFGVKTPEQAIALMLIAQAEGLHPAIAARDYNVIQGRPALKADAVLARFQTAGGRVEWTEYTDAGVTGVFSHPSSPRPVPVRWTMADAQRAGLAGKDVWRQYPRQMLRARVISEGVRTVFPGVTVGTYTVEEVQDMTTLGPELPRPAADVPALPSAAPARDWLAEIAAAPHDQLDALRVEIRAAYGSSVPSEIGSAWSKREKATR